MAGSTLTHKVEDLTLRLQEVVADHKMHRAVTELRLRVLEQQLVDRIKWEETLTNKIADLTAKNAVLEEHARGQEKLSDRGFNFVQAAIISVVAMIGGALLSLLVQLAIKK